MISNYYLVLNHVFHFYKSAESVAFFFDTHRFVVSTITELQTIGFILSFVFHVLVLCISHALTLGLTLGLETFCKTTVMVRGFESLVRLDSLIDSSMRPSAYKKA